MEMELENMFSDETFFLFFPPDKVKELTSIFETLKSTAAKVKILQNKKELEDVLYNNFSRLNPKPDAIIYDEDYAGIALPVEMIEREIEPVSVKFFSNKEPVIYAEHKKTLSLFVHNALYYIRYKVKEEEKV